MTTNLTIPRGLALLSIPLACLAAGAPAGSPPETKPYTLFMGADFEVQHQKEFYRAHGVHEGSLVIKVGDKDVLVSMSRGPVNMKVDQELKLTEASATVQELKSERAYTPANDPVRKFRREQTGGASHLQSNAAEIQSFNAQGAANRAQVSGAPAGVVAQVQASAAGASANFSSALAGENSSINDTGAQAGRMQDELAKKLFDAMDVTFQVSSPKPLSSPYVVILAEYREHNEKPGAAHNWIYAQELAPISSEPRKVHILQGGLPQGFELLKLQLHLYNRGRELATNVADKQVALTREEAVQYLLIDYLGSHKGATLPATPALGRLTPEARARLAEGQYRQPFFVQVNKDGVPQAAFVNESCSQKVEDAFVESLIMDVRFNPALEKGRPIDGVASLKFSELSF